MQNAMLIAIPFFLLTMLVEWFYGKYKKQSYFKFSDMVTNLSLGVGSQVTGLFTKVIVILVYDYLYRNFAFFELGNSIGIVIACIVLFDFIYYWAHRWSHEWNWLWGAHVVHHQSEEYNLSVALRQSWFHGLMAAFLFFPMAILGFNTIVFGIAAVFITLYQYWIHTRAIKLLPKWFEFIFNTPSHHRVHHGVEKKYIDKNHAAFLIIWDRMFGTFQIEEEEPHYRLTKPFDSWNPVWANFHHYVDMYHDAKQMSSWKDRFKLIFAPPGWRPKELGGQQAPGRVVDKNYHKYDVEPPRNMKAYVFVQLICLIGALVAYMSHFESLSLFYKVEFALLIAITTLICGAILENKKWILLAERARLLLAALSINALYYTTYADWFTVMLIASVAVFVTFNIWLLVYRIQLYKTAQKVVGL